MNGILKLDRIWTRFVVEVSLCGALPGMAEESENQLPKKQHRTIDLRDYNRSLR